MLLVDDDPVVREVVARYLEEAGFRVDAVGDGAEAQQRLRASPPDLAILDVMLPGVDGLSLLRQLRTDRDVPVILLTARGEEIDRIAGLELGADDYVVKPFSARELVARARSVLRRAGAPTAAEPLSFDGLSIDPSTREVAVEGHTMDLTRLEFDLLLFLASAPRQVFTRAQLLEQVWDSSPEWQDPSTVTVHIRRLRRKVETDPDEPRRIVTARGVGYRFEP